MTALILYFARDYLNRSKIIQIDLNIYCFRYRVEQMSLDKIVFSIK